MNLFKTIKDKFKKKPIHIPYIIEIVGNLTTKPITIEGKKFKPRELVISDIFFRSWGCGCCAKCCRINTTLILADKINIPDFHQNFIPTEININGNKKTIYIYNKGGGGCKYLNERNMCTIESIKPLQCKIHPNHVDIIKEKLYLRKRQYGRNWKFGCQIQFTEYNKIQQLRDIAFFNELNNLAKKLGIETHIPRILKTIEEKCYEK